MPGMGDARTPKGVAAPSGPRLLVDLDRPCHALRLMAVDRAEERVRAGALEEHGDGFRLAGSDVPCRLVDAMALHRERMSRGPVVDRLDPVVAETVDANDVRAERELGLVHRDDLEHLEAADDDWARRRVRAAPAASAPRES